MSRTGSPEHDGDLTAKARLRAATIAVVAEQGITALKARTVAERAGVSPGLIAHHFGSMDGLRRACDEHVLAVIREQKRSLIAQGPDRDIGAALGLAADQHLYGYIAAVVMDDSPAVTDLVDHLVADTEANLAEAARAGMTRPTNDPRRTAILLTLRSLGELALHSHLHRLLGVDLTNLDDADPAAIQGYLDATSDLLGGGLFTAAFAEQLVTKPSTSKADQT